MRLCKDCINVKVKNVRSREKVLVDEKKCATCAIIKPIKEFYKRSDTKDGYGIYCKICGEGRTNESFVCTCGLTIKKSGKSKHLKTAKHKNLVESICNNALE